jgi:hypothetical protein
VRLIFDADPVVYAAGFAAERQVWDVVYQDADGNLGEAYFEPHKDKGGAKEQANAWLTERRLEAVHWERRIIPEPVEFALQAVSTTIRGAMNAVRKEHGLDEKDLQLTVLLSGPGNWRDTHAKIAVYKGNRDPEHKPYHYQAIRNYLVERWGARVIVGHEADDEVSILARQHIAEGDETGYVVCTIDKDLDQVPGYHYDYKKHVHYAVTQEHAERWFWIQALSGDPTDNIPGCYRIATKTAEQLVDKWMDLWQPDSNMGTLTEWLWRRVVITYTAAEEAYGAKCPWVGKMTAAEAALETAQLVFMQHQAGKLWEAPCH